MMLLGFSEPNNSEKTLNIKRGLAILGVLFLKVLRGNNLNGCFIS